MLWYQQLIISLAASLIGGAGAAWVTMRLSLRRFYRERWWQRRFDGCAAVIEAFHDQKRYLDMMWVEQTEGRDYQEDFKAGARTRSEAAMVAIRKYADLGVLALPPQVASLVKEFVDRQNAMNPAESWFEYLDAELAAVAEQLSKLTPAAINGLGLPKIPPSVPKRARAQNRLLDVD